MLSNEVAVATVEPEAESPTERSLSEEVTQIEFRANSFTIQSEEDYNAAASFGRLLKQKSADVKEFWKPMKDAAHRAHSEICAKEKAMLKPLENAEKILKQTMGAYVAEQERRRREAEEAARKLAGEEVDRKMAEALKFEASGDAEKANAALEEAEIMDETMKTVSIMPEKIKAQGVTTSKDWEIIEMDESKIPIEVSGVVIRPVDASAVMRLIRSSKGTIQIPGITYRQKAKIAFRR